MDCWYYLKIIWTATAFILLCTTALILWRVRGVLSWKRSLKAELKELAKAAETASPPRKEAVRLVEERCSAVFRSASPEIAEIQDVSGFVVSIAACFHPQSEHPELQVTVGRFLRTMEKSLERFDCILKRPGFKRLGAVSIRNIRAAYSRYLRISSSPAWQWFFRHQKNIRRFSQVRLIIFPDPFTWLAFLSHHLTILMLIKYLMADLYLFFGKLALEAYDEKEPVIQEQSEAELEDTLKALDEAAEQAESCADPGICDIRKRIAGFPAMIKFGPSFEEWKQAVYDAALIISKKYFPESETPLEEAMMGPLLERTREWIGILLKGEDFSFIRRTYKMRLETLFRAKNLSDTFMPKSVRNFSATVMKTYGWAKWPLKIYRMIKDVSPWGITMEVGWMAAKTSGRAYISGKVFDKTCKELETVYRDSRMLNPQKKNKTDS